jgi:hypothetical protein
MAKITHSCSAYSVCGSAVGKILGMAKNPYEIYRKRKIMSKSSEVSKGKRPLSSIEQEKFLKKHSSYNLTHPDEVPSKNAARHATLSKPNK